MYSKYPTLEQIENADRIQIARWYRFLPSPGLAALGQKNFVAECNFEAGLMHLINHRFEAMGGMNSELSKAIAWH